MFDFYKGIGLIIAVVFLIIQVLIIHYLLRLEKIGCKCAMDWRRSYIIFFMFFSILYTLSIFFINRDALPILQMLMTVLGLMNVVFTLQYVHKLKKEKCECSASIYREVMMVVAIFNAILYSSLLIIIIYFLYTILSYAKVAQNKAVSGRKALSIKPLRGRK